MLYANIIERINNGDIMGIKMTLRNLFLSRGLHRTAKRKLKYRCNCIRVLSFMGVLANHENINKDLLKRGIELLDNCIKDMQKELDYYRSLL